MNRGIYVLSLFLFICLSARGQGRDTVKVKDSIAVRDTIIVQDIPSKAVAGHSPRKTWIYSLIIPGGGQIYNRKWWKVPIIYAGFVGLGLVFEFNHSYYKEFLREAQLRQAGQEGNPKYRGASLSQIIAYKDLYRRNRDLSVIGGVALYGLNVLDAYIDARFFRFDISDDLSLQIQPEWNFPNYAQNPPGATPMLKFRLSL